MNKIFLIIFLCILAYGSIYMGRRMYTSTSGFVNNEKKVMNLYESALAEKNSGDLERAKADLDQALEFAPENKKINILLGDVYTAMNFEENAVGFYERGLSSPEGVNSEDIPVMFTLSRQYVNNHNLKTRYGFKKCYSVAMECYQKILGFEPQNTKAMLGLGICQSKLEDYQSAKETLDKLLKLNPDAKIAAMAQQILNELNTLKNPTK
ncbi:MAG: tetratricopeptide repeat protein [Candidatus Wallbacteria bacterium]|nr:tetratricopeptide repeat protein [Candidatus Wallbacteria bacterium]